MTYYFKVWLRAWHLRKIQLLYFVPFRLVLKDVKKKKPREESLLVRSSHGKLCALKYTILRGNQSRY